MFALFAGRLGGREARGTVLVPHGGAARGKFRPWIEIAGRADSKKGAFSMDFFFGGLSFFLPPWISTSMDSRWSASVDSPTIDVNEFSVL